MINITKVAATAYKERMHTLSPESIERLRESGDHRKDNKGKKIKLKTNYLAKEKNLKNLTKSERGEGKRSRKKGRNQNTGSRKKIVSNNPVMKSEIKMIGGMNHGTKEILRKNNGSEKLVKGLESIKSVKKGETYVTIPKEDYVDKKTGARRSTANTWTGPKNSEKVVLSHKTKNLDRKSIADKILNPFTKITHNGLDKAHANALVRRHEAYEVAAGKKTGGKGRPSGDIYKQKRLYDRGLQAATYDFNGAMSNEPIKTGTHYSGQVLANEARDTRMMGNRKVAKGVEEMRTESGEKAMVKKITGKDMYKQKLTPAEMKKLDKAKGNYGQSYKITQKDIGVQEKGTYDTGKKIGKNIAKATRAVSSTGEKAGVLARKALKFLKR